MTARQRKILVIGFVIGSVLAAAVDIASACPKGGKSRSSSGRSGLYAQNRSTNHTTDATMLAKHRTQTSQLPPAPPANMVVEEYQLVSNQPQASTVPEIAKPEFTPPVIATAAAPATAEANNRQHRNSAALEKSWKQNDAAQAALFTDADENRTAAQFDVVNN